MKSEEEYKLKDLIIQFAKMYNDGSCCDGCKYENYASCENRYKGCEERIKIIIEGANNANV